MILNVKKMKKLFIIALWSVALSACTSGVEESSMKATITNLKSSEINVKVYDMADYKELLDTTVNCKNGKFSFKNRFTVPTHVYFSPEMVSSGTEESKAAELNTMKIELYMFKGEHYELKGSVDNNILLFSAEGSEISSFMADLRTKYVDRLIYSDKMMKREELQQHEIDSIYKISAQMVEKMKVDKLEYVKTHLESQLSGLYLSEQNTSDFDTYYPQISESVRTGLFKSWIEVAKKKSDLITNSNKVQPGTQAIDFTLNGLDGETITLSSYKGKNVLLYFWGTW